jgi:hypothetical protein
LGELTTRDRFHAVMGLEPFDRLPIVEWAAWWDETVARWHAEGLPAEVTERYDINRHFGVELYLQDWFWPLGPECPRPAGHGAGILADAADYDRIRPHLLPLPVMWPDRVGRLEKWAAMQERGEAVIWVTLDGFFWWPRMLFGIERHLYAFYDQPDLMRRMNQDMVDWQLAVVDELCAILRPDFMTFAEDMSYNHGPMLSEQLFREFMAPFYAQVVPRLHELGCLCIVDSDGDVTAAAPWFEGAGLDGILPLERQAGVDVSLLRRRHPGMRFVGCFDKMTMNRGEAAMRSEFERLLPVAAGGGLIVSVDHQTPPGVSYDDYLLYLRLFREYADEAGRLSRQ